MRGIWKFRIIISGWSSLTFSTATLPLSASPQISQSLSRSMQARTNLRTTALSSTIRTEWDIAAPLYPRQAASRATSFRLTDGGRDRAIPTLSTRAGWGQYGEYRTITNICWYDTAHPAIFGKKMQVPVNREVKCEFQ